MLSKSEGYSHFEAIDIKGGGPKDSDVNSKGCPYPTGNEVVGESLMPQLDEQPPAVDCVDFDTLEVVHTPEQDPVKENDTPAYGRLDKNTSVKELDSKGFPVPPVFASTEESEDWQASGGAVIARPYFAAPWDSAIFLPGLNSAPLIVEGTHEFQLEINKMQWDEYIRDLWENQNLQGYLQQYGVSLAKPPDVSYLLQGCVHREKEFDVPITSTMVVMDNEDRTHMEWQTAGFQAKSGIYIGNQHQNLDAFMGFPLAQDGNGVVSSAEILDLHHNVKQAFGTDRNLQVEVAYGVLKPGDKPQPYVVQARDFPQMRDRLWDYGDNFGKQYGRVAKRRDEYISRQIPPAFVNEIITPLQDAHKLIEQSPYVLSVEGSRIPNDEITKPFPNMRHLWIQERWSEQPLMHGLFSLVELAHIRGGKVILG